MADRKVTRYSISEGQVAEIATAIFGSPGRVSDSPRAGDTEGTHLSDEDHISLMRGDFDRETRSRIALHLSLCVECASEAARLSEINQTIGDRSRLAALQGRAWQALRLGTLTASGRPSGVTRLTEPDRTEGTVPSEAKREAALPGLLASFPIARRAFSRAITRRHRASIQARTKVHADARVQLPNLVSEPRPNPLAWLLSISLAPLMRAEGAYAEAHGVESSTVEFPVVQDGTVVDGLLGKLVRVEQDLYVQVATRDAQSSRDFGDRKARISISDITCQEPILRRKIDIGVTVLLGTDVKLTSDSRLAVEMLPEWES